MLYIYLERDSKYPLTKQVYSNIKTSILEGRLSPKSKLPSTRRLSQDLKVSRNVVIEAYEQLLAEGYTYSIGGSGTYVADGIHYKIITQSFFKKKRHSDLLYPESVGRISFRAGIPDLNFIPILKWGKTYKEVTESVTSSQLDYQNSYGVYELRLELAKYLHRIRGVYTSPDNILITNGAAQGFHILKCIVTDKSYVFVENPSSIGLRQTLDANKISYLPIAVDDQGIQTDGLPSVPPKLIFTTPSHQFPTGVILPIKRRIELIKYAINQDAYIVEDDYDSEFRYNGSPIQSMQHIEPSRVIYIGTFSKTLSPAIRLGYMVLPDNLLDRVKSAKYAVDIHSPVLEQLTMARFIREGYYEKHVEKMKKIYSKRRVFLIDLLESNFQHEITISGMNAGLHFVGTFPNVSFTDELMEIIFNNNIDISPLRSFYINNSSLPNSEIQSNALIFGYGNTDENKIHTGVRKLQEILENQFIQ